VNFFYWNKNFEIGIPEVDRQHRRLVDLINELGTSVVDGAKLPQIQALIYQLLEYASDHFSEEELLLDASALPNEEKIRHKKAHTGFVQKVQEIAQRHDIIQIEVAEEILDFLTTWLISHILGADIKLAQTQIQEALPSDQDHDLLMVSSVERVLIRALSETERRFRLISDQAPALIWVADSNGRRGYFNRSWTSFVGVDQDSAEATDSLDFVHPDDRPAYKKLIDQCLINPKPAEFEYRLRRKDGEYRWVLEKILPRIDVGNIFMGLIASATDITAIKQAELLLSQSNKELEEEVARRTAQLEQLMLTDPLTGVGNRRFLMKRLEEENVRAKRLNHPLTIVFFDVDHFKDVNDRYGHAVGDIVLARVADSLKARMRDYDVLARFGGEEFVALLLETDAKEGFKLAERMRIAVSEMKFTQIPGNVTISAGLAERNPGESIDVLLQRSDRALYKAKETGRNRCILDPKLD
jgi:diguanylate cyclase (GGDEF)-like protein/hemerythrin-like metal-binding protein/PAS domain S-box-containing protein